MRLFDFLARDSRFGKIAHFEVILKQFYQYVPQAMLGMGSKGAQLKSICPIRTCMSFRPQI